MLIKCCPKGVDKGSILVYSHPVCAMFCFAMFSLDYIIKYYCFHNHILQACWFTDTGSMVLWPKQNKTQILRCTLQNQLYTLAEKSYGITCTVSVRVAVLLDFQNFPSALMEFVCQAITYKCLATPLLKIYIPSCSRYVRFTWSTGKSTVHSKIANIHITIALVK